MNTKRCEHCHQIVMVRRRNLRADIVSALAQAATVYKSTNFKVSRLTGLTRGAFADFAKLKYWGLIEKVPGLEMWRVTQLGRDFLEGIVTIPKYKWIFNDTVQATPVGEENPEVSIRQIENIPPTLASVRATSMTYEEYSAQKNGSLF